jgi:hypothetical protein
MRLIDVCIPKFDDDQNAAAPAPLPENRNAPGAFQGLFGQKKPIIPWLSMRMAEKNR